MSYLTNHSGDHEKEYATLDSAYPSHGHASSSRPLHLPGYGRPEPNYNTPFGPYGYGQPRGRGYPSEHWVDPNHFNATGRPYHGLTPDFSPWDRPAMHGTETGFSEDTEAFSPPFGSSLHHNLTTSSGVSGDDDVETPSADSEEPDNANNVAGSGKKYQCPKTDCSAAFSRKADKDRHFECVHRRGANKKYDCLIANCSRVGDGGFTRKDHLTEHLRNYHHQNIPKRRKARSAMATD